MGMCAHNPADDEKRHKLHQLFWRVLKDFAWMDEEYLRRKAERTPEKTRGTLSNDVVTEVAT